MRHGKQEMCDFFSKVKVTIKSKQCYSNINNLIAWGTFNMHNSRLYLVFITNIISDIIFERKKIQFSNILEQVKNIQNFNYQSQIETKMEFVY